jgi:phosphoglycolate phosphatase
MRLAVFDCDGTLVDGQADVCWAMERAFTRAGLPAPDPQEVRRIVGLSLPARAPLAPDLAKPNAATSPNSTVQLPRPARGRPAGRAAL